MSRQITFILVIGYFFTITEIFPCGYSYSPECANTGPGYIPLISVFFDIPFLLLLFFYPKKEYISVAEEPVNIWRRFIAYHIDLFVVILIMLAGIKIIFIFKKILHMGGFPVESGNESTGLIAILVIVTLMIYCLFIFFYYHYKHLTLNKPTIGQYVLGYMIDGNGQKWTTSRVLTRFFLSAVALGIWPVVLYAAIKNEKKHFWFDRDTNSFPVRIAHPKT